MISIKVDGGNEITVTPEHKFVVKDIETDNIIEVTALEIHNNPNKYLLPCEE